MAFSSAAVALNSSTATAVVTATRENQRVKVKNNDAAILIYLGGTDVTSSNGFTVAAGGTFEFESVQFGEVLYAIAASGTPSVRVLKQGI